MQVALPPEVFSDTKPQRQHGAAVRTSEFIVAARAFNMGITGGVREHPTKWRTVIHRRGQPAIVVPFDSQEAAVQHMRTHDPRELDDWAGTHVECPEGYTPKKARLPVYGRRDIETRLIESKESWNFGRWLLRREDRIEKYDALIEMIDEEQDPNLVSVKEAHDLVAKWIQREVEDGEVEDGEPTECERSFGASGPELETMLVEAEEEWLESQGLLNVEHVCADAWAPLKAPQVGGVYFLLSVAPQNVLALKIGWSKSDINRRIADLQTAHPWPLRLLAWIEGAPISNESALHRRFKAHTIKGSPGTEWFHFDTSLMRYVGEIRRRLVAA